METMTVQSTRNDDERRLWVLNDEGLYLWHQREGGSVREFIRRNRAEIDAAIDRLLRIEQRASQREAERARQRREG